MHIISIQQLNMNLALKPLKRREMSCAQLFNLNNAIYDVAESAKILLRFLLAVCLSGNIFDAHQFDRAIAIERDKKKTNK